MSEKQRVAILVLIMAVACSVVTGVSVFVLYRTAFEEARNILESMARNHARFIEVAVRAEAPHSPGLGNEGDEALKLFVNAHNQFKSFGHTGEFTLAKLEGGSIVYLIEHRYKDFSHPRPVPMNSKLAEPMRRALSGQSGSMVGLDYRGAKVLAAYEPIAGLNWGIVAKVDLDELRIPFARAGTLAAAIASIVVLVGALLFLRVTNPIMAQLKAHSDYLAKLVFSLQQNEENLRKARDELETRVSQRTSELVQANQQLADEVKVRARIEERSRALLTIAGMINADEAEVCDRVLAGVLQMTQSLYAFYGILNDDESVMSIYAFSKEVEPGCEVASRPLNYSLAHGGMWAEAVRQKRVVVVNDYKKDYPGKRGTPEGHIRLTRILAVPVLGLDRVVAVVVAANKPTDYDEEDIRQLEAFAGGVQRIIDQRRMDIALRTSEKQCRQLSQQVIEAQETERKLIAREIHDCIGQSLAAIKYRAETYLLKSDQDCDDKAKMLQPIIQMIREAMEEVRKIQNDLRPAFLDMSGVLETISDFCERYQETYSSIKPDLQIDLAESDIPEYLKVPIFRIFQEAMNNAAKHSKARRVLVRVQREGDKIELSIEDDGIGFALEDGLVANSHGRGLGLFSMKERAELSGGSLDYKTANGDGTAVRASWTLSTILPV
jgi:signal transduction histidine kinase